MLFGSLIGQSICLTKLNKRHGLSMLSSQVFILTVVRSFNDGQMVCTQLGLLRVLRMNKHGMSSNHISNLCKGLVDGGLLVLRGGRVKRYSFDMRVTTQGRQLLDEYEVLLNSYIVKGVPVAI